jgi:beta-glucosidase
MKISFKKNSYYKMKHKSISLNRVLEKGCLIIVFLLLGISAAFAQVKKDGCIEQILSKMNIEEKVALCSGDGSGSSLRGIPRLGIPKVGCTDGPRGPNAKRGNTAFPCGVLFGSTWNPTVIQKAGRAMGEECWASGKGILLAPGLNILRDPLGGRFFEYYTEDPYLNCVLGVADIKGIQSAGVAACAKHFVCNNREDNRNNYMSIVDERTLNEIYFPVFKAAVQKGNVDAVMTSANGVNYEFVSDSKRLLTDILKGKWGFQGLVMTDWLQTRSTEKAAFAGLDVSMPGGEDCLFASKLLEAVKAGKVSVATIDDKARRILRVYERLGILDNKDIAKDAHDDTLEHHAVAREVAEQGIVLLKNEKNALPLNKDKIKKVLVTGPNANKHFCTLGMGGSSWIESPYEVTALKGIQNMLGQAQVTFISSDDLGGFSSIPSRFLRAKDASGYNAQYFVKGKDTPIITRVEPNVNFMWEMRSPDKSIKVEEFKEARFDTEIIPPIDGKYTLRFIVGGGSMWAYKDIYAGAPIAVADASKGNATVTADVDLKKGSPYRLCIVYTKGTGDASIRVEWEEPQSQLSQSKLDEIDAVAKKADAVVFVGGIDNSLDTEGCDRKSLTFPLAQEKLINHLSTLNSNTTVVLMNGSPLEIGGWLSNVRSVVEAWYPGMEGGTAISNILFGKTNPSGRLSFTWPKRLEDSPCKRLAHQDNDVILFSDSLMVGYRYYDTKNVEPQYPFGYGLSYTTFEYSNLRVRCTGNGEVRGSVQIRNTGKTAGDEVVQLYVKPIHPSVSRPVHELKFFRKITLRPNETRQVNFVLNKDAFSYYDVHLGNWKLDKCSYKIEIGRNSRSIIMSKIIHL